MQLRAIGWIAGFDFRQRQEIISTSQDLDRLWFPLPVISPGVKTEGREADYSP
jgi:hypothetical protein